MRFVAVDGDPEALERMERCLKATFRAADIVPLSNALGAYKYCVNHAREISVVFIPIVLKPIDGFKLRELISTIPALINVVFVLREESAELLELIAANGACRHIIKPVTQEKIDAIAKDMVNNCWSEGDACNDCALFWCEKHK